MLLKPFLPRKVADSSIMSQCHRAAFWMFYDTMPKVVDVHH